MAALKPITPVTCRDCGARASVTLIGVQGDQVADFCRRHGGRALRERLKTETTETTSGRGGFWNWLRSMLMSNGF